MLSLRPYQQQAVDATLNHFRQSDDSAVLVLPTGAGKSLIMAELARLARQRILVLAHVKELVEQNHQKFLALGREAGIFSAGLNQKDLSHQVTFASVQSLARNLNKLREHYSLVIIDECHRVSDDEQSQYQQIIEATRKTNAQIKVLGLTATPYRLGIGWIYRFDYRGFVRSEQPRPFQRCIYEVPLHFMIKQGFLTPPNVIDAPVAQYDFSSLSASPQGLFPEKEVNQLLVKHPRVTQSIVEQILHISAERRGVMIFAATVRHANEIMTYLGDSTSAIITGETAGPERDEVIRAFKAQKIKYLVNVAVLTTGFDAPHVDVIAILRPTQSVSLYQQIVGRGLRLYAGKRDCLVIDYAGNGIDLFSPEVGSAKPVSDSVPVQVLCPACGFANCFWGKVDSEGQVIEHYGRRCQGVLEDETEQQQCDYRFRFKECSVCNGQNDIAARQCQHCGHALIDPDEQLKQALRLKNATVLRCSGMTAEVKDNTLIITYYDEDGMSLKEWVAFNHPRARQQFNQEFGSRRLKGTAPIDCQSASDAMQIFGQFSAPDFVIARKQKHHWQIQHKLFDYQGAYRKANQL